MAGINEVVVRLVADMKEFQAKMGEAGHTVKEFGKEADTMGGKWKAIGSKLSTGVLMGVGGALVYGTEQAYKFNESLDAIVNQSGATVEEVDKLRGKIIEVSNATGYSADSLSGAALQIEKAGAGTATVLINNIKGLSSAYKTLAGSNPTTLQAQFQETMKQLGPQLQKAGTNLNNALLNVGQAILPAVSKIAGWVASFAGAINSNATLRQVLGGTLFAGVVLSVAVKLKSAFDAVKGLFTGGAQAANTVATDANTAALEANTIALGGESVGSTVGTSLASDAGLASKFGPAIGVAVAAIALKQGIVDPTKGALANPQASGLEPSVPSGGSLGPHKPGMVLETTTVGAGLDATNYQKWVTKAQYAKDMAAQMAAATAQTLGDSGLSVPDSIANLPMSQESSVDKLITQFTQFQAKTQKDQSLSQVQKNFAALMNQYIGKGHTMAQWQSGQAQLSYTTGSNGTVTVKVN